MFECLNVSLVHETCQTRTVVILSGNPNRLKTWSRIIVAVASAVAPSFEQGTKIIPFVRPWSTTEKIESSPRTCRMSVDFELLAEGTALHVVLDECTHSWPPIMGAERVIRLQFTWVTCSRNVMISCHDFMSDVYILWYVAFIAIKENRFVVNVFNRPVREISLGFCWSISL